MSWQAKPSGGYTIQSAEGNDNVNEIWSLLSGRGYTQESAAGVCGNLASESGLNPWRWQGDSVNVNLGYGLFQFTPASGYLALSGVSPNMSTSSTTPGASPSDGARQVNCFADDELSKWQSIAWRPYWDTTQYASLYAKRAAWLAQYGSGGRISLSEFSQVTDIEAATFFFLACYEGPAVPNLRPRTQNAKAAYDIISGGGGGGGGGGDVPTYKAWLLWGLAKNNNMIIPGRLSLWS